jgi:hypothetical protein
MQERLINELKERNWYFYQTNCAEDKHVAEDAGIIAKRMAALDAMPGMRVGDFLRLKDGTLARVAYHWGHCVQPSCSRHSGSFYLADGYVSYSGGLDASISITEFRLTGETDCGLVWIFHRNFIGAGRGVDAVVPFRVYEQIERLTSFEEDEAKDS